MTPLGHISCILEDARRDRPSSLALGGAEEVADRDRDRVTHRASVMEYDYEKMRDLMES